MSSEASEIRVADLFRSPIDASWFAPGFLAAVPVAQVEALISSLDTSFGAFVGADIDNGEGRVQLSRASVPVRIGFDADGRIDMLWFGIPQSVDATLDSLTQDFEAAAAGDISILVVRDSETVLERNADRPMAVGSAFKLLVLQAYETAIATGDLRRDTVVAFEEQDRSLPSGTLQVLPAGTPVTLELLATLMIQISDNTATDTLMRVLGRQRIETLSPRNAPFLTTRELFQLIAVGDDLRARYAAGTRAERAGILEDLAGAPLPEVAAIGRKATWHQVEWFLSAHELCALLIKLDGAPALTARDSPLLASLGWPHFSFKGGSEFGVLNFSAIGTTPEGDKICAVLTANADTAMSEIALAPMFSALFPAALSHGRASTPSPPRSP